VPEAIAPNEAFAPDEAGASTAYAPAAAASPPSHDEVVDGELDGFPSADFPSADEGDFAFAPAAAPAAAPFLHAFRGGEADAALLESQFSRIHRLVNGLSAGSKRRSLLRPAAVAADDDGSSVATPEASLRRFLPPAPPDAALRGVLDAGDGFFDVTVEAMRRLCADVAGGVGVATLQSRKAQASDEVDEGDDDEEELRAHWARENAAKAKVARRRWRKAIIQVVFARRFMTRLLNTKILHQVRLRKSQATNRTTSSSGRPGSFLLRNSSAVSLVDVFTAKAPPLVDGLDPEPYARALEKSRWDAAQRLALEAVDDLVHKMADGAEWWKQVAYVLSLEPMQRCSADIACLEQLVLRANAANGSLPSDLRACSRAARADLLAHATEARIGDGATVVAEGDVVSCAYLVLAGRVNLVTRIGQSRCVASHLEPGDSFGDGAMDSVATGLCLGGRNAAVHEFDAVSAAPTWLLRIPATAAVAVAKRRAKVEKDALKALLGSMQIAERISNIGRGADPDAVSLAGASTSLGGASTFCDDLHALAKRQSFANGEVISRQGDVPKYLYLVLSGECRVLRAVTITVDLPKRAPPPVTEAARRCFKETVRRVIRANSPQKKSKRKCHFELPPRLYPGDVFGFGGDHGYHPFSVIPTTLVDVLAINVTELYNKHDHLHRRLMAAATDRYKPLLLTDSAVLAAHKYEKQLEKIMATEIDYVNAHKVSTLMPHASTQRPQTTQSRPRTAAAIPPPPRPRTAAAPKPPLHFQPTKPTSTARRRPQTTSPRRGVVL